MADGKPTGGSAWYKTALGNYSRLKKRGEHWPKKWSPLKRSKPVRGSARQAGRPSKKKLASKLGEAKREQKNIRGGEGAQWPYDGIPHRSG